MGSRTQIATYIPKGSLESLNEHPVPPRGPGAREPTTAELADLAQALHTLESLHGRDGIMVTAADDLVANLQTFIATVMGPAEHRLSHSRNGTLEARFDSRDILGWAGSFFTWWRKLRPFEWRPPGPPHAIPDSCRVALLADWGTGLYGAPTCAESITRDGRYALILHLGDVYYSGTAGEMNDRFLELWPKVPGALNRGLNGNHEMYSGGQAYIETVQKQFGQTSSWFALENGRWILACLDTTYTEHDLHGDQATWVRCLADTSPNKKLLLFSHHQPFSLLDNKARDSSSSSHRCSRRSVYMVGTGGTNTAASSTSRMRSTGFGAGASATEVSLLPETRLFGSEAPTRPVWRNLEGRNLVPSAQVLDGENVYVEGHASEYRPNGYMTLEFDGDNLYEIVHLPDGTEVWNQPIERLDE